MTTPLRHILVPTDFSDAAEHALLYAASLGERYGATIHVIHVVTLQDVDRSDDTNFPDMAPYLDRADAAARQALDAGAEHGGEAEATVVKEVLRSVNPHEAIIEYAGDKAIDLVVIAMRGRSRLSYMLLGSVTERVVRYAPCPVLVVEKGDRDFVDPATGAVNVNKVVIAHDLSDRAQRALTYTVERMAPYEPELHLVHVVESDVPSAYADVGVQSSFSGIPDLKQRLEQALGNRAADVAPEGWKVVCHVTEGKVHKKVNGYAADQRADLLVVGSESRRSLAERLVGGTAEQIIRHAPCPTLIA
jgi:nucleotide-binding universal stress UspA family protein